MHLIVFTILFATALAQYQACLGQVVRTTPMCCEQHTGMYITNTCKRTLPYLFIAWYSIQVGKGEAINKK